MTTDTLPKKLRQNYAWVGSSSSDAAPSPTASVTDPGLSSQSYPFSSTSPFISGSLSTPFPATLTSSGPPGSTALTTSTSQTSPTLAHASPTNIVAAQAQAVCIGHGIDASATGLIATAVLPSAVGLLLWVLFALIRPHYRQLYGVREWFIQPDLRPQPLRQSMWAFLFPHVPVVPSTPKDVSNAGRSPADDAHLFPSDEQLSQRSIYIALLLVLGWTILGLAGALPLYLVSLPCLAHMPTASHYTGAYSTLQDLSLLRLLRLWDSGNENVSNYHVLLSRSLGGDSRSNLRIRVIVLTVLSIALALAPATYKLVKEFNRLVAYRRRWINVRCGGNDLGWLSVRQTPGFAGWGEKKLKDFITKTGLSSSFDANGSKNGSRRRKNSARRAQNGIASTSQEGATPEVDITGLFTIVDTHRLALLIDERDLILENLEIAETKYITSFRLTTPDPSIADFQPRQPLEEPIRPYISRPRALSGKPPGRGRRNPAFAASSLAPTTFVAPSQYYKLRDVHGISGGRFAGNPSLSDSIRSRLVGTRFQEIGSYGTPMMAEKSGEAGPSRLSPPTPDIRESGPSQSMDITVSEFGGRFMEEILRDQPLEDEWVDLTHNGPTSELQSDYNGMPPGPSVRTRPKKGSIQSIVRETFPLRNRSDSAEPVVPPPHLRLQTQGPFVRPLSGINHGDLGEVYNDISQWRSKLKAINAEIQDAQMAGYNDVADGTHVKGWLLIGKGLRFIPGIELIEGRAKEDIRWDVLQNERTALDSTIRWTVVGFVTTLLAAGLIAAIGLASSSAPGVAHTIPFLRHVIAHNDLTSGLTTTLAPAVAVVLFVALTIAIIDWAGEVHGSVSVSKGRLVVFRTMFFILAVIAAIGLVVVGALIFAIPSFGSNGQRPTEVANGAIYMTAFALSIILTVAIISPALLMLQPFRLWRVSHAERHAVTPRQRFRAIYPRSYNPSFATGACVLAIIFASTFSLIFPLIGPAVLVLLLLTLIAHRYLIGYVYARTNSQTGGVLQMWLLKRLGTLLSLQPILLGLILLSRQFWIEGGILVGMGVFVVVFVECYTRWKTRLPGRDSLSAVTIHSLDTFTAAATDESADDGSPSFVDSAKATRTRGSMASVLEMMSLTLAVMPSPSHRRGPIPLQTETLDDLTATERAARTHPDAPPHLPPLAFTDHAEDMAGILYAPELIAPAPIIWLPNDYAGVARSEAFDLQKYHGLRATLDVRTTEDVPAHPAHRTSTSQDHS